MKGSLSFPVFVVAFLAIGLPAIAHPLSILETVRLERPEIRWDEQSIVIGNFKGGPDFGSALLGYSKMRLVLAIESQSIKNVVGIQYLEFVVDASRQDGVCSVPAKLESQPLECSTGETKLPGCRPSPNSFGLSIVSGECDSTNLYWSHLTNNMQWWRR